MRRYVIPALLLFALGVAAACGGSGGSKGGGAKATPPAEPLAAEVATRDVVVGPNRFAVGLLDSNTDLVLGADVHLRFFKAEGQQDVAKGEADARYVSVTSSFVRENPDGTRQVVEGNEVGVYVTDFDFDGAGFWTAEAAATLNGRELDPVRTSFEVLQDSLVPAVGEPAPLTRQTTLSNVPDITQIDTSPQPIPEMHQTTIADAVQSGRPTVITFATPAFCQSRLCGPVKSDVVDPLFGEYRDRVNFVHVEPYDLAQAREGRLVAVPAMAEWSLTTEPWVFVIDAQGKVAARFEGLLAVDELRAAVDRTLASG